MKGDVKSYRTGAAAKFVDNNLSQGRVSFSLAELTGETGLSDIAARNQLLRLGNSIQKVSPRLPYFLIVAPEHRRIGAPPVEWWLDDYFKWIGQPYYLALQSAAAVYGSSPQAIQETQIMTPLARREIKVGRIRLRFFVKSGIDKTLTQQLTGAYAPLTVSTPESTLFDLVRYAHNIGGIERAAETITPLITLLRSRELKRVLDAENETTTAQRLGFLLSAAGANTPAKVVRQWLPQRLQQVFLSVQVNRKKSAPVNREWSVIENAGNFS